MRPRMIWFRMMAVGMSLMLAGAVGCSSTDAPGDGGDNAPPLVQQGWDAFETGDYSAAASAFRDAIADDAGNAEAHNGLGWALVNLGNLSDAIGSFDAAIDNAFEGADPHVGRTVALRDREPVDYAATIEAASTALAIDGEFSFAHAPDLDWKDVRLILAQSHFALGDYAEANDDIAALGGTPQNPSSPTFAADLLQELERLGDLISN